MRKLKIFTFLLIVIVSHLNAQENFIMPDIWMNGDKVVSNANEQQQETDILNFRSSEGRTSLNFNPAITFSKSYDAVKIPYPLDEESRFTIFTVYYPHGGSSEQGIWGVANSSRDMVLTTSRIAGPSVSSFQEEIPPATPIIHTVSQFWPSSKGQTESQELWIGNTGQVIEGVEKFEGIIPEVILFRRNLSSIQRNIVETYLAVKYGITLYETDYRNSREEVIWNFQQNESFAQRITGIGRDDAIGLHQKQSTSSIEPNVLSIGVNNIAASNKLNTGELQDLDFLLWGDNDLPLVFDNAVDGNLERTIFSARKWKIQAFGGISEINTEVLLNSKSMVIPEGFELVLAIDRSGNGKFETPNQLDIYPATYNEGIAGFLGVKWDIDKSGFDVFTFGLQPKENNIVKSFTVSPNPSSGFFQIDVKLLERSDMELNIYSLNGTPIKHITAHQRKRLSVSVNLVHSGEYIIALRSNNVLISQPLIISTK